MTQSPLTSFALFLRDHQYSTRMWENGYTPAEANGVCHHLTEWAQTNWALDGEFLMLWASREGAGFFGDSELVYVLGRKAHLIPNPFLEGDAEGFVVAFQKILSGELGELYSLSVAERVLFNAV